MSADPYYTEQKPTNGNFTRESLRKAIYAAQGNPDLRGRAGLNAEIHIGRAQAEKLNASCGGKWPIRLSGMICYLRDFDDHFAVVPAGTFNRNQKKS